MLFMANISNKFKGMITGLVLLILVVNILPVAITQISGLDLSNVGGVDYSWGVTIIQIVVVIGFLWYAYEHFLGKM